MEDPENVVATVVAARSDDGVMSLVRKSGTHTQRRDAQLCLVMALKSLDDATAPQLCWSILLPLSN